MSIPSGSRLGPYELTAPIGAGGMGEVYRATDPRLGREVALKVLPEAFASDPERLARFAREARLLAALNHPGIAHLYGFEAVTLDDGATVHLLAMELVEGEDLALRLKRGPIPVDEAIDLARQVAEALEEAHERGIVHRDVKPANLKLTPDGRVKVLDFGLAKAYAGDPAGGSPSPDLSQSPTLAHTGTAAGLILGTAAYMSPEQARGRAVDRRADVWAFGVVLYEMLTGRRLFTGETVSDVLAGVLTREPDWSLLPGTTPSFLRDLLRRCLDRDPRSRLRDIGEARVALERARATSDVPARRGSRRTWLALLGAALAGGLVVAVAVRFFLPASGRTPVLRKVDLLAPDLDLDWNIAPALSPDGSRVAWSAAGRIWVRDLDQLEARSVAETSAPTPLCWSPDSRTVAFGDLKKLWKVPAQGGARTAVADVPGTGQIVGAAWSPAGQIALAVWRGGLYEVSERGGAAALRLDVDGRRIGFAQRFRGRLAPLRPTRGHGGRERDGLGGPHRADDRGGGFEPRGTLRSHALARWAAHRLRGRPAEEPGHLGARPRPRHGDAPHLRRRGRRGTDVALGVGSRLRPDDPRLDQRLRPDPGREGRRLGRAACGRARGRTGACGPPPGARGRWTDGPPDRRRARPRAPPCSRSPARRQPRAVATHPAHRARAGRGRGPAVPGRAPARLRHGRAGAARALPDPLPERRGTLAGDHRRGSRATMGPRHGRALLHHGPAAGRALLDPGGPGARPSDRSPDEPLPLRRAGRRATEFRTPGAGPAPGR